MKRKRGFNGIQVTFKFSHRVMYTLIALTLILIVGVGVYAIVQNPGHAVAEIDGLGTLATQSSIAWSDISSGIPTNLDTDSTNDITTTNIGRQSVASATTATTATNSNACSSDGTCEVGALTATGNVFVAGGTKRVFRSEIGCLPLTGSGTTDGLGSFVIEKTQCQTILATQTTFCNNPFWIIRCDGTCDFGVVGVTDRRNTCNNRDTGLRIK